MGDIGQSVAHTCKANDTIFDITRYILAGFLQRPDLGKARVYKIK